MKHLPKVFVVDDDLSDLESVDALLALHGYDLIRFTSAEEFLAQHHPTQVGCILIDHLISGMSGRELLQRLRDSGSLLSVIVTTTFAVSLDADERKWDSVTVLEAPYNVSTLLKSVEDGVASSIRRRADRRIDTKDGGR